MKHRQRNVKHSACFYHPVRHLIQQACLFIFLKILVCHIMGLVEYHTMLPCKPVKLLDPSFPLSAEKCIGTILFFLCNIAKRAQIYSTESGIIKHLHNFYSRISALRFQRIQRVQGCRNDHFLFSFLCI